MQGIQLEITKKSDKRLLERMRTHYSQPKGFVGRSICYAVYFKDVYYGHIVSGSATRFLPGRNEFLNIDLSQLNHVVNNVFFNVSKPDASEKYPIRNFTTKIVSAWMRETRLDWEEKYGDEVLGYETLIEHPRTGELYRRAGFIHTGDTIGYTCKRVSGKGGDSWSGKRVWDTENLRPKKVMCRRVPL